MRAQKEIIISGVGGQGMILCGTLIAEAAVIHDGKRATLSTEYGVETRGTFAKADVIISEEEIFFPDATEPNLVVCLAQAAYERYSGKLESDILLIYNTDEVEPNPAYADREVGYSIDKIAREMGNPATANIITMGIIVGVLEAVTPEAAKESIGRFFTQKGEKVVALNRRAFDTGYAIGKSFATW